MFEISKSIEIHFSMADTTASRPPYCHLHTYSQVRRTYHLKSGQERWKKFLQGSGRAKVPNSDTMMRFLSLFCLYESLLKNRLLYVTWPSSILKAMHQGHAIKPVVIPEETSAWISLNIQVIVWIA